MSRYKLHIQRAPTHLERFALHYVDSIESDTRRGVIDLFYNWWLKQDDELLDDLRVQIVEVPITGDER